MNALNALKIEDGLMEGQVVQRVGRRGAAIVVRGTARAAGLVTATLATSRGVVPGWKGRAVGRAAKERFAARLAGVPAGGPYRLELRAGGGMVRVASFFVGDVWLLAGQSNMEGCANRDGASRPDPRIRALSMRREWRMAEEPLHVKGESPDACHTAVQCSRAEGEALRRKERKGSGPALHFAREMLRRTGVPQGLVCAAHGGTSMRQWDPALKARGGASLYGSLLLSARVAGPVFAGMLWYQGESDASPGEAALYAKRMRTLVAASRRDLRQPRLPWLVVQIGRHIKDRPDGEDAAWNRIQELQRLLPEKIAALDVVAAVDLPLDDGIHIGSGGIARLGDRLARAADRLVHGNRREAPAPRLRSIGEPHFLKETLSRVVDVAFDHVPGGLRSHGEPGGFTLVSREGKEFPAVYRTVLRGGTARLYLSHEAPPGLSLCYGYGSHPVCTLTDGRDMALPVFGPLPLGRSTACLPFVTRWRSSGIVSSPVPLAKIAAPEVGEENVEDHPAPNGFVNKHPVWQGKSGHACFASRIDLPEPMRLEMLAGYDGPFRLWIDRKPFFDALDGTNPCLPDEGKKTVSLSAGTHELTVAMDINDGLAWGFFLRFRRVDVSAARIVSGDYVRPAYRP